ncbi:MAG: hypothetical protein AB1726_04740 [Planctomycetota bacterium]
MSIAAPLLALALLAAGPAGEEPAGAPETMNAPPARAARDRGIAWLAAAQNADGSWCTGVVEGVLEMGFPPAAYYAWKVAASAIACLALLEVEETPAVRSALDRGLAWLCAAESPRRGADWDVDHVWGALYGFAACVEAARDPRFAAADWPARLREAGGRYLAILERTQSPRGGWGYYDDPIYSKRPKWDTSFCTALVLPALAAGVEMGWVDDPRILVRARGYVSRCALPNGAYGYDLDLVPRMGAIAGGEHIDAVPGSLGRVQVCNWGLARAGERKITPDRVREGLEAFLRHHRFLDVAWTKPVPHEAFYYNSGYFYAFGHYYAAEAIQLLPEAEREAWHARLRPHLVRRQRADGSLADFLLGSYTSVACTAFLVLALDLGLPAP